MKYRSTLLILLFCLSLKTYSFNIDWVKSISTPQQSKGLFCDSDSNVYNYGNNFFSNGVGYDWSVIDTTGTFFYKYSPAGQLLLAKRWRGIPFYMQDVVYDGNASIYFTGTFAGSLTIDGITITSRGKGDGMIGKMDLNGTILWMKTFGSSKDDRGQGICFDGSHTKLLITGSTTDSLFVDNVFIANGQQSTLVATFNLSGVLQNSRLFDFLPFRDTDYYGNWGQEVRAASGGNYFLFSDCQGSHWNGDSIVAPVEGRYLIKLNASLDTLWRKWVIGPGCYYGWQGDGLRVSALGDPYLTSYCSMHYGGFGHLTKFNPNNGMEIWDEVHEDGGFDDIFIEGNTIYSAGTEGAIYAPGPSMNSGYPIVKMIDQNGVALDSLKMERDYGIQLTDITTDGYGNTYVTGYSGNTPMAVIGNDTLYATYDAGSGFYLNNYFLLKLNQSIATSTNSETAGTTVLFPNPNQGMVNLQFGGLVTEGKVCVYGPTGNCLMMKTFTSSKDLQMDLKNFSKGIYFIEVVSERGRSTHKIILQ